MKKTYCPKTRQHQKKTHLFTIASFFFLLLAISNLQAQILFEQAWGEILKTRKTHEGEVLAVSSVFSDSKRIYLYDMAGRRLVGLDTLGRMQNAVRLQSIGRRTYVGDDFVVKGSEAIFLNTVDKKLEIFDVATGHRTRSITYPLRYFSHEKKRRHRIINRIFLDGDQIVLGNTHRLFYLDPGMKKAAARGALSAPAEKKIVLFGGEKAPVFRSNEMLHRGDRKFKMLHSRIPVPGKRYFFVNDRLYGIEMDSTGLRLRMVAGEDE